MNNSKITGEEILKYDRGIKDLAVNYKEINIDENFYNNTNKSNDQKKKLYEHQN